MRRHEYRTSSYCTPGFLVQDSLYLACNIAVLFRQSLTRTSWHAVWQPVTAMASYHHGSQTLERPRGTDARKEGWHAGMRLTELCCHAGEGLGESERLVVQQCLLATCYPLVMSCTAREGFGLLHLASYHSKSQHCSAWSRLPNPRPAIPAPPVPLPPLAIATTALPSPSPSTQSEQLHCLSSISSSLFAFATSRAVLSCPHHTARTIIATSLLLTVAPTNAQKLPRPCCRIPTPVASDTLTHADRVSSEQLLTVSVCTSPPQVSSAPPQTDTAGIALHLSLGVVSTRHEY